MEITLAAQTLPGGQVLSSQRFTFIPQSTTIEISTWVFRMNSEDNIPSEILNALLSSMFEISPIAMSISTSSGRDSQYLRVNEAYLRLVGRQWADLKGVKVAESAVREDEARIRRHRRLATEGGYVGEYVEIHRADGVIVPTLISAQRSIIDGVQYDVEIIVDISARMAEQRAHEQALAKLARTDVISKLPNRLAFDEKLREAVERGCDYGRPTLALLDLDGFKAINDLHGHAAGDEVLQTVADRIAQTLRAEDYVFRIGGDEFAILFRVTPQAVPEERLEQIIEAVSAPMAIAGQSMEVGVSMGVVRLEDNEELMSFFRRADSQMYAMKNQRKPMRVRG